MFAGVVVPLVVLSLVVAGVIWGALRAAPSEPAAAAPTPSASRRSAAMTPAELGMPLAIGGGTFNYRVAGTAYRQEPLSDLRAELLRAPRRNQVDGHWGAFVAELRPQTDNSYDPDAVAVIAPGYGTVGWLNRGDGAQYRALLSVIGERNLPVQCPAEMHKGRDGALGVRLDLATPAAVASKLKIPR